MGSSVGGVSFVGAMEDLCGKEGVITEMWGSGCYEG